MSDKDYMREYMREYSSKRRLKVIAILGGVCSKCGTKAELQVHHVDPTTKSFDLADRWHRAWKDIEKELPKCVLLCDDCHRTHHKSNHPHGTPHRYWRGCRCPLCTNANREYNIEYRKSKGI